MLLGQTSRFVLLFGVSGTAMTSTPCSWPGCNALDLPCEAPCVLSFSGNGAETPSPLPETKGPGESGLKAATYACYVTLFIADDTNC